MCKDINDKNTKAKNQYQKHDSCFKIHKKNAWKTLENLETRKNRVTDKKYGESGATS